MQRRRRPTPLLVLLLSLFALIAGDRVWQHGEGWQGNALPAPGTRSSASAALAGMSGPACLRALAASGAGYSRIADFTTGPGCGVAAAVQLHSAGGAALSTPTVAACPLALALQRHAATILQPAARALFDSPIARIDHVGSFACRRIRGRPAGPLSQHAFARALDVTGFATADGRQVTVADWPDTASPQGRFLRRIAGDRGSFTTLLTPDHDRWHHDHLHFGLDRPPTK